MSTENPKNNGARLSCLIIDIGTKIMRKYFDSIFPNAVLASVLHHHSAKLLKPGVLNPMQQALLFPRPGMPPTNSENYDIILLFILFRRICNLTPPPTGWKEKPADTESSPVAQLIRIKYYRNLVYAHRVCTDVSNVDFKIYWNAISGALTSLSNHLGYDLSSELAYLKTRSLDVDHWINLLIEWYESDHKIEVRLQQVQEMIRGNSETMFYLFVVAAVLVLLNALALVVIVFFIKTYCS